MTYKRFQILNRHLRPFDYTKLEDDEQFPEVFQCAQPWSEHIQYATTQLCEPGSHLAVDEGMIRYTGRNSEITYVPGKPTDTGFKEVIYVLTDDGDKVIALNSTQSVVIALINLLPQSTYHIFVDNIFSSPDLFLSLRQHGHGATGTAHPNCGIYKEFADYKVKDQSGKSGFKFNEIRVVPTPDNQVNQIAWKDNALVLFLSTVFKGDERCERWRKRPSTKKATARPIQRFFGDEASKLISTPTVATTYNDEMNHVDRGDQMRAYQGYDHPIRRGAWQALTWTFLLDVVLVNSYLLQRHGQPNWSRYTSQKEWRRRIYNELFKGFHRERPPGWAAKVKKLKEAFGAGQQ
ncbi:hypothetical protein FOTG_13865 [Fusarium oxysporum f. sp. vasinfectum 25433]|uniref:PiggyBac transposable element-derived protein domain-containing protein n=1 Tax=Fusarium oxysporum f. sp. vasinfectum 25433 TaxID=1089449 RepID=X0KWQ5_FUSOX|nr:hypothetical protein FOTG_13865 [Fusarium oxysporum f. sp. vasinfectum 25433]